MKLGSIVGLIIAAILAVTGTVLCVIGSSSAKSEGRELFMKVDESGTHYVQDISSEVTKLSIECKDADIIVKGNAERSYIEFNNFNPNKYSVSATANVVTFSESADITSLLDLGDIGFSFKGLRYFLDPRNDDFDALDKSIVINVAADSSLKIIDIDAETGEFTADGLTVSGDILLNIKNGSVTLKNCSAASTLSISGDSLKTTVDSTTAKVFRHNVKNAELLVKASEFTDSDITSDSGRIDFTSEVTLDTKRISVTSETGIILVNSASVSSPFIHEPTVSEDSEEKIANFKITSKSASVNLQFPTEIDIAPTTP